MSLQVNVSNWLYSHLFLHKISPMRNAPKKAISAAVNITCLELSDQSLRAISCPISFKSGNDMAFLGVSDFSV